MEVSDGGYSGEGSRLQVGIVIACIAITVLACVIYAQQAGGRLSDLYVHANRYSALYNLCVENMNQGRLDLKSCFAANEAWERLYAHPDWPKKPKKK